MKLHNRVINKYEHVLEDNYLLTHNEHPYIEIIPDIFINEKFCF